MKLIVFYHALLEMGDPPQVLPAAIEIIHEHFEMVRASGLEAAASEFHVGVNCSEESRTIAKYILPDKAKITVHGMACKNENRTILMVEERVRQLGDEEAYIFYSHSKSASHDPTIPYAAFSDRWRRCMQKTCITRWRECVAAMDSGVEAVGAHWLSGQGWDHSQHYFAGTFFWATSKYLKTLPSIMERDRIKTSGIDSAESRYEAEVWIGNGPRIPKVKDLETSHGFGQCP